MVRRERVSADSRELQIRAAQPSDQTALGRLGALLVREHYDFDQRRFISPSPQTAKHYGAFLESQLQRPDIFILVAAEGDEIIGYTYAGLEGYDYMSLRGPAGVLYDIVVDPGRRAQGIGRMLLDATLDALRAAGAPRVLLSTAEQNEPAQRLFAGAGFRRTMIEMTRELTDDT